VLKKTLLQFITYNIVGIANTLVGFSIIFSLMYLGISPTWSNLIGYSIGAILSYYLNKKYTFKSDSKDKKEAIKFFTILLIAYSLNFITLQWLLTFTNPYLAQLISAIIYTLSSFLLARIFVFNT
jgi:putative flippase GtrA